MESEKSEFWWIFEDSWLLSDRPAYSGSLVPKTIKSDFHNKKWSDSGETFAIDSTHVLRPHTKFGSHPSTLGQVMVSVKSDFGEFREFGPYWAITRDKFLESLPKHFRWFLEEKMLRSCSGLHKVFSWYIKVTRNLENTLVMLEDV